MENRVFFLVNNTRKMSTHPRELSNVFFSFYERLKVRLNYDICVCVCGGVGGSSTTLRASAMNPKGLGEADRARLELGPGSSIGALPFPRTATASAKEGVGEALAERPNSNNLPFDEDGENRIHSDSSSPRLLTDVNEGKRGLLVG
jgi:hypothetical protein